MANDIVEGLYNEGLLSPTDYETASSDLSFKSDVGGGRWIDADTVHLDDGTKVRLSGYDAKEVAKHLSGRQGEIGGAEQTAAVSKLAREMGYNRLVPYQDKVTGKDVDPFGRKLYTLVNAAGTSFGDEITAGGVIDQNRYTTQAAQEAAPWEQLYQSAQTAPTEMQVAKDWIADAITEQGGDFAGFKQILFDESEIQSAGGSKYAYDDAVQVRNRDRGYNNKAKNPLSTSWDTGWTGVLEGLSGSAELLGNRLGWEGLEDKAEGWKQGYQYDLQTAPTVLMDYKDVNDTGDFIEYVGNLAASSLPYMAITIGAAALSPATGGLSLSAPAAIYAGQVWNEMGDTDETEKNASIAIGAGISMAVLDRLGVKGLANTSVLSSAGRKQLIDAGVPEEEIVKATQLEAAKLFGNAAEFAKDRLNKQEILRNTLGRVLRQGTQESITEVAQETTAYLAAVAGSDKEYDPDDLLNRVTNAAIGGGVLGGGFALPGQAINTGKWADIAYRLAPADQNLRAQENQWAEETIQAEGYIPSNEEIAREAELAALRGKSTPENIAERAKRSEKRKSKRTATELRSDLWEGIPGLWRGSTRHALQGLQEISPAARKIGSLFNGGLFRTYSGANYEAARNLRLGEYSNLIDVPLKMAESFGFKSPKPSNLTAMSDIIYGAYNLATKRGDTVDWDSLEGTKYSQHINALKQFDQNAKRLTQKLHQDQQKYEPELGHTANYAYRHRSVDKRKVESNPNGFKQALMGQLGVPADKAQELVDTILQVDAVNDLDEAFAVIEKGGFKPGAHKKRTLNMSDNAEFANAWLNSDIMANLSNMSKSAARFTTDQDFLGKDNSVLNQLVADVERDLLKKGWDADDAAVRADRLAQSMKDYLDAHTGNYKRPESQMAKNLLSIQKNFMFVTTLSALPLATISSMVELALTAGGLNKGQINTLLKNSKSEINEMMKSFWWDQGEGAPGRQAIRDLNYFDWETGAGTRAGATEISHRTREFTDVFFKSIGLSQFTDMTRAMRASIAGDFFKDHLEVIRNSDAHNPTNEYIESLDALRNHGFDVEKFTQIGSIPEADWTPEDADYVKQTLRNATYEFINNAVVLPGTANRPLFYNDPRFALFTQFHGFISSFQATVLPKLYRQAFKGQTPSMKYNAFAVMTTMIMLGFMSQYIKDLIKFGRSTPYIDDPLDYVQRGIGSTGLLGVSERALNLVHPIYESRYDNVGEWAFDTVAGEAAAVTKARQLGAAGVDALSGEGKDAYKKGWKFVPYVAPLTEIRNRSADWAFGEDDG